MCVDCRAADLLRRRLQEPAEDSPQAADQTGAQGHESDRRHARARFLLELFAHVLGPPLNAPDGPRYWPNGSSAGDPGFGGRVGISTSPMGTCIAQILVGFGCLDGGLALGYAPYPRFFLFEMQVGGFVY